MAIERPEVEDSRYNFRVQDLQNIGEAVTNNANQLERLFGVAGTEGLLTARIINTTVINQTLLASSSLAIVSRNGQFDLVFNFSSTAENINNIGDWLGIPPANRPPAGVASPVNNVNTSREGIFNLDGIVSGSGDTEVGRLLSRAIIPSGHPLQFNGGNMQINNLPAPTIQGLLISLTSDRIITGVDSPSMELLEVSTSEQTTPLNLGQLTFRAGVGINIAVNNDGTELTFSIDE